MASKAADTPVLWDHRPPLAVATLNRPERSNALSPDLVEELVGGLRRVAKDRSVRVIVLAGAGRSFCAGLDLKHLGGLATPRKRAYLRRVLNLFQQVWRQPQPVVAAINGAAVAGGFDLCVFCDLRVASSEAVFAQTEILLGLNPVSTPLHHLVGLGHARELAYLGAKITADEAHRIGLVNHVVPQADVLPRALEVADQIARRSWDAVATTKRLTREMLDQTVGEGLRAAGQAILRGMSSPKHQAQLAAYLATLGARRP